MRTLPTLRAAISAALTATRLANKARAADFALPCRTSAPLAGQDTLGVVGPETAIASVRGSTALWTASGASPNASRTRASAASASSSAASRARRSARAGRAALGAGRQTSPSHLGRHRTNRHAIGAVLWAARHDAVVVAEPPSGKRSGISYLGLGRLRAPWIVAEPERPQRAHAGAALVDCSRDLTARHLVQLATHAATALQPDRTAKRNALAELLDVRDRSPAIERLSLRMAAVVDRAVARFVPTIARR